VAFDLADYVPVAERLAKLRADHPDAVLQTIGYEFRDVAGQTILIVCAACWTSENDQRPGIAFASEPFPGKTPYTRDSEIMNAETSAWGRAIVAKLAADTTRSVASRDEVAASAARSDETVRYASDGQIRNLQHLVEERGLPDGNHGIPWPDLLTADPRPTMREASGWIDQLKALPLETPPPVRVQTLRTDSPARSGSESEPVGPGEAIPFLAPDRPWNRRPFPFIAGPDLVERWWTVALAALPGIGPAKLLAQAREIATEQGRPVPADLAHLNDPETVAAVRLWMDTRADEKAETA